jgi:hypothetical protein
VKLADNNKQLRKLQTTNEETPFAEVSAMWLKGRTLSPTALRAIQVTKETRVKTCQF